MDRRQSSSRASLADPERIQEIREWIRKALIPFERHLGEEREDLEQEVLLDLTRDLRDGRFRGESSLRTYVRSYVRHKALDHVRKESRRRESSAGFENMESGEASPYEELRRREMGELSRRVMDQLGEPCRELWKMIYEGMSYKEMSRVTGIAKSTLRVRVMRCRKRALSLREELMGEKEN